MGLREKVALAVVAVTTQIICNHCLPEALSNALTNSSKRNNVKGFKTNKTMKKNLLITDNDFKGIRFPEVEYPSSQVGDCFRLQNAHEKATQKCKYDEIDNAKPCGYLGEEPALPPHRLKDPSFFPEVEYPLSARDMWAPKYWNQLHDHLDIEQSVEIVPKSQNPLINTKYSKSKYKTSPIKGIMKTSNTNNKLVTKTINNNSEISIHKNNNDFIAPNNSSIKSTKTPSYDNIVPVATDVPMEKITSATICDLWYSGVTFATTASPFDKMTSPITPLETRAPSNLSAESFGNYTLSEDSTTTPKIKFPGEFDALTENWVLSKNDSIVTWKTFPEDDDDWIIFVDTPKPSPTTSHLQSNDDTWVSYTIVPYET